MTDTIEKTAPTPARAYGEIVLPARRTPLYRSVDVLVCGGGPAGAAAAAAAARNGADTLLVERNVVLGGNGPLSFLVGLPAPADGIATEVADRLRADGDADRDALQPDVPLIHDPEAFKYALVDLVREAGAKLLLSSWAADPIVRDGAVRGAMVENKSGRFAISAKVVIDATGDGDLALRAGAAMQEPDEAPPMTMNCRIGGVDIDRALAGQGDWPRLVAQAKADGLLAPAQPDTISLYGLSEAARQRSIVFLRAAVVTGKSAWNADDLTAAEIASRELARQFVGFLKTVPGFEGSFLVDVAGTLGITRSRHIVGDHVLRMDEALGGETHADDVLLCKASPAFGLPYRCLLPAGVENMLVAGRAASVAPDVYERFGDSIDCAALGEAAGRAAAAAALRGVSPRAHGMAGAEPVAAAANLLTATADSG